MTRYHVDTPAQLELVRVALDQAQGLRDAAGVPVVVQHTILRNGVAVGTIASDVYCAQRGVAPTTLVAAPILGGDGTAALELPEIALVEQHLGKTRGGVPIPNAAALIQVTRARQNTLLPAGVRDKLDDAYADQVYAANTALGVTDTAAANAAITVELQNGSRAANAITRKGSRAGAQAIAQALGIKEE